MVDWREEIKSGQMIPDIRFQDRDGREVRISDFRNRANLVLMVTGEPVQPEFTKRLLELKNAQADLEWENAQVLVVCGSEDICRQVEAVVPEIRFPLLIDQIGKAFELILGSEERKGFAVVILDRYGEIYNFSRSGETTPVYTGEEILDTIRFIELQCPE